MDLLCITRALSFCRFHIKIRRDLYLSHTVLQVVYSFILDSLSVTLIYMVSNRLKILIFMIHLSLYYQLSSVPCLRHIIVVSSTSRAAEPKIAALKASV